MFEQTSTPSLRSSQQDNKAYRLNLTSRALDVLKLAQVNIDPIIAKQGKLLGEIISAHCLEEVTCNYDIGLAYKFSQLCLDDPHQGH